MLDNASLVGVLEVVGPRGRSPACNEGASLRLLSVFVTPENKKPASWLTGSGSGWREGVKGGELRGQFMKGLNFL